jgi:hypothetical protein
MNLVRPNANVPRHIPVWSSLAGFHHTIMGTAGVGWEKPDGDGSLPLHRRRAK